MISGEGKVESGNLLIGWKKWRREVLIEAYLIT